VREENKNESQKKKNLKRFARKDTFAEFADASRAGRGGAAAAATAARARARR
jgi:hypothetical protein